jgi:hypothetical protein
MIALSLFETDASGTRSASTGELVSSSGRRLKTTAAFTSYWALAAERQAMFFRRLRGDAILTHDKVLREHRFTNAYRAADRVSQFFISHVASSCERDASDIVFRTLLFKTFNRIETWNALEAFLGEPIHWSTFSVKRYDAALTQLVNLNRRIYSNAYMMPNPSFGHTYKHSNHLELLSKIITSGLPAKIEAAPSLESVYALLREIPSFGPFLAFQYAIDLNYTDLLDFEESDFVVAGPGALDGIRKCFEDVAGYTPTDIIRMMADIASEQFEQQNLDFATLWGRPLQLIDCQNLFCEVDKYSRAMHPELSGASGRTRIKQRYSSSGGPLPKYKFPERWRLDTTTLMPVSKLSYTPD